MSDENLIDQSSSAVEQQPTEKMLSQSEVNALVGSVRKEAYEKGKRESVPQSAGQLGGMQPTNEDEIRRILREETQRVTVEQQRAQQERETKAFVDDFTAKVNAGREKYAEQGDYDETIGGLSIHEFPDVALLTKGHDNVADILYHLGKNPSKLAYLDLLSTKSKSMAQREMAKLANSLRVNEEAQSYRQPNEPLDQIKSSPMKTGNNDGLSVEQMKRKSWAKF